MRARTCPKVKGHFKVHLAIVIVAFTRALAYSPVMGYVASGPAAIAVHPALLATYSAIWLVCAVLAILDWRKGETRWAVPVFIGLMTIWGISYIVPWVVSGFMSWDWMTAALYLGVAMLVSGKHDKIATLSERVRSLEHFVDDIHTVTAATPVVEEKGDGVNGHRDPAG